MTHKGHYGHGLLIAGSPGMIGAALLAGSGALKLGLGKLTYAGSAESTRIFVMAYPEAMSLVLHGRSSDLDAVLDYTRHHRIGAIAVGPGLGVTPPVYRLILGLLAHWRGALILDADALNVLDAKGLQTLRRSRARVVLTPHEGEFARLFGRKPPAQTAARIRVAKEIANQYHCTVLLKGFESIVASPTGEVHRNRTGTPALARGGAGDLLTGMILGFVARGFGEFWGTACAVFFHGLTACSLESRTGATAVLVTDVLAHLPRIIGQAERVPDLRPVITLNRRDAEARFCR